MTVQYGYTLTFLYIRENSTLVLVKYFFTDTIFQPEGEKYALSFILK